MNEAWITSVRELEALLTRDPNDVRALLRLGDLYLTANRVESALPLYERAARRYESTGSLLKAVAVCKQVVTLSDKHGVASERVPELRAWLDELEKRLSATPLPAPPSVEQVFEEFKAGVAAQISEADSATHFDLGAGARAPLPHRAHPPQARGRRGGDSRAAPRPRRRGRRKARCADPVRARRRVRARGGSIGRAPLLPPHRRREPRVPRRARRRESAHREGAAVKPATAWCNGSSSRTPCRRVLCGCTWAGER